jgi:hypothetical protein
MFLNLSPSWNEVGYALDLYFRYQATGYTD